jgi:LysR family transcriptional regulator (chromosome initiation inhibitor)
VLPLGLLRYHAVATPDYRERWLPDGPTAAALAVAPVVDFDRRDDLQSNWLSRLDVDPSDPPRHFVPASNDFARAIRLGLGWGLLPRFQSAAALVAGELVGLGGPVIDVALFWQQWKVPSDLLDEIAAAIVAEGRRVLEPRASG